MGKGLNPLGAVLKKADVVLADAGATLDETKAVLAQVQAILHELHEEMALVKEIPELKRKLEQVHEAVASNGG
jgi:hypothetical protein